MACRLLAAGLVLLAAKCTERVVGLYRDWRDLPDHGITLTLFASENFSCFAGNREDWCTAFTVTRSGHLALLLCV